MSVIIPFCWSNYSAHNCTHTGSSNKVWTQNYNCQQQSSRINELQLWQPANKQQQGSNTELKLSATVLMNPWTPTETTCKQAATRLEHRITTVNNNPHASMNSNRDKLYHNFTTLEWNRSYTDDVKINWNGTDHTQMMLKSTGMELITHRWC